MDRRKKADESHQVFGDCRDRLPRTCLGCAEPLVQVRIKEGVAGKEAHGEYACGSKMLAWEKGHQSVVRLRLCELGPSSKPRRLEVPSEGGLTAKELSELEELLARFEAPLDG